MSAAVRLACTQTQTQTETETETDTHAVREMHISAHPHTWANDLLDTLGCHHTTAGSEQDSKATSRRQVITTIHQNKQTTTPLTHYG